MGSGHSSMAILKFLVFIALAAGAAILMSDYFFSEEPTVQITEQFNPELLPEEDQSTRIQPDFRLFTDMIVCKAITNAVAGANLDLMNTAQLDDKIVISFTREADGKDLSYNCRKVNKRFYLESTSKFFSQSVIEVEPKVSAPRIDELILYIFDTSDTGNIVKTYSIDDFE